MKRNYIWLGLFFIIALLIRFMFFPANIYFGYDQARDSYSALELLKGHLKLIGPPSSLNEKIFHGPLIYYIYAPVYFLFHLNPEAVAVLFRIINALGLVLVYKIGEIIFNKKVGLIAAFLYSISYEQSQYSLFLSHPALSVLTVLVFYLGLSLLIFKKEPKGLVVLAIGIGLSIQFHYVNLMLLLGLLVNLIYFRREISPIKMKWILYAITGFLLTVSSFIIAEFKFNFREIQGLTSSGSGLLTPDRLYISQQSIKLTILRFFHDNFISSNQLLIFCIAVFSLIVIRLLFINLLKPKIIFLMIWLTAGFSSYAISGTTSYYHAPASSVSLIIIVSFLISLTLKKNLIIGLLLIFLIGCSNINLILAQNYKGPNSDIVIQPGMLTIYEKEAIDYCYSGDKNFSVNALTIPLYINTTWSYLFNWYGLQRYGYLPVWGGIAAAGYSGSLKVVNKRSNLPARQCLIIEPTVGMNEIDKQNFFREESYFSTIIEQKNFGTLTVQLRKKI